MTGLAGTRGAWRVAARRPGRDLVVDLTAMALVGVAYYLGARLGLTLSLVERNVTPLWPPTGIAVAAFLLMGRSMWPGVALAAFAVNLPISEGALRGRRDGRRQHPGAPRRGRTAATAWASGASSTGGGMPWRWCSWAPCPAC